MRGMNHVLRFSEVHYETNKGTKHKGASGRAVASRSCGADTPRGLH